MYNSEEEYLRINTKYYIKSHKPLQNGNSAETLIPWSLENIRFDFKNKELPYIKVYKDYCCIPSHVDFKQTIDGFYNQYHCINHTPTRGNFNNILRFLTHIFGVHYELALDYIQLLYLNPLQKLPILLLVSSERSTGKTTFLIFLSKIFEKNMIFLSNTDLRSQFNADWSQKLIIAFDEALLNRKEDSERIKNLSTTISFKDEAKGKDRKQIELFAKFILCSNNEHNAVYIDKEENRYWVVKVPTIKNSNADLIFDIEKEIPAFLWFLSNRVLSTKKESRLWFREDLYKTKALDKIKRNFRNELEGVIIDVFEEIFEEQQINECKFCLKDIMQVIELRKYKTTRDKISIILQENFKLKPQEIPKYYKCSLINCATIGTTGRYYTITADILKNL